MKSFVEKKMKKMLKETINTKRIIAVSVMSLVCILSMFSVLAFSRQVKVVDGDKTFSLVTMNSNVAKILEQAGVDLEENDTVTIIEDDDLSLELVVNRAFDVKIKTDGGKYMSLKLTCENTVGDALDKAGIKLEDNHFVSQDLNALLEPGMEISVEKRVKILISADGRTEEYSVPENETVLHAIIFADIPLYSNDVVSVDLDEKVSDGMEFSIERVGYKNSIVTEIIPFEKITKKTSLLDEGTTQVSVKGQNGEREIFTRETIVDGEVVSREEVKSRTSKSPVNEVILVGTRKKSQTVEIINPSNDSSNKNSSEGGVFTDNSGKTVGYKSKLTGKGTAYTAESGAKTSTGKVPTVGTVAVDPKIIPYGSKLYIKSADGRYVYGYAYASDTGGALLSGRVLVDLYMNSEKECFNFGRRDVVVYVL